MCYVLLNTKSFRCGATTGQVPVPVGTVDTRPVRPGAISTTQPRQCRYMKRLALSWPTGNGFAMSACLRRVTSKSMYPSRKTSMTAEWTILVEMIVINLVSLTLTPMLLEVRIQFRLIVHITRGATSRDWRKSMRLHESVEVDSHRVRTFGTEGECLLSFENWIPESLKLSRYAGTPLGTLGKIMSRVSNHQAPNLGVHKATLFERVLGKAWDLGGPNHFCRGLSQILPPASGL
ncbi:hypothetical protein EV361DRAFT_865857 [Lentinula raphanica]|nr:hypothetical protein EV361DRAFT_865857 [Lentinula raphanica]